MIDMLLVLVLLTCFAVINRWAHRRDLAAAARWRRQAERQYRYRMLRQTYAVPSIPRKNNSKGS